MQRLIRNSQSLENLVVELVAAEKEFVEHSEELAGLGALNDAVIVGGG